MKKRVAYSYAILRYVHDTATSEFVNVGVAVYCADERFFDVTCRSTIGRLSEMFPDIHVNAFRSLMRHVSKRFKAIGEVIAPQLALEDQRHDLEGILRSVLPKDDSALIWSPVSAGLTFDPGKTLDDLFVRYVARYDHKTPPHKRTDDDIWKDFNRGLENRHIATYFDEKVIAGKDDEVTFKSAWKNGKWHCIEPVSFDLSAAETIREKAHRFLGQIASVADASADPFKVYLVVGKPSDPKLAPAAEKAVSILCKLPVETEVFMEDQKDALLNSLERQIRAHELP